LYRLNGEPSEKGNEETGQRPESRGQRPCSGTNFTLPPNVPLPFLWEGRKRALASFRGGPLRAESARKHAALSLEYENEHEYENEYRCAEYEYGKGGKCSSPDLERIHKPPNQPISRKTSIPVSSFFPA